MPDPEPDLVACDLCRRLIPVHTRYIVRIDVFADPSLPPTTAHELATSNPTAEIQSLLKELRNYSVDDLQDQVHRHFEYSLCPGCQAKFLANPLGKPRSAPSSLATGN